MFDAATDRDLDSQDDSTRELAAMLKAAGDELRLQILRLLMRDSFGVMELSQIFGIKQSGMSHHLKVLARVALVSTRREGNSIYYRRSLGQLPRDLDAMRFSIYRAADKLELPASAEQEIRDIYAQRASASEAFFADNASSFEQHRDLIAAFDVYGAQVENVLRSSLPGNTASALEVGPGGGEFLPVLSDLFDRVVALDNSKLMLQRARDFCAQQKIQNVDFVHADTRWCEANIATVNCVVINMVLHHTPSPAQIFKHVSQVLTAGGALLICDLCDHNQDWVRSACGDQWLGFDPADLNAWAAENNLHEEKNSYFALRNGFQIQIHHYVKL